MGIHENGTNTQTQPVGQTGPAPAQSIPNASAQTAFTAPQSQPNAMENALNMDSQGKFDWTTLNLEMMYTVNISPNSMSLSQFEKAMREYWDQNITKDLVVDMFTVDRNSDPNLAVSILVVTVRPSNTDTSPVAYHTLLIESSIEILPPRIETYGNNRQIEIMQLTSDVYDQFMMRNIESHVRQRYPKATAFLDADGEVIPRYFDLTKEDNIRNITTNSILACRSVIVQSNPAFKDLNLQNARRNTSNLTQAVYFYNNEDQELEQSGFPIRSDIVLQTMAAPTQSPNNYTTQNQTLLTRVTGYIDLLYDDAYNFNNQTNIWYGQPMYQNTQVYHANFIITNMINYKMQTLPATLLALINASSLRENNLFLATFTPEQYNKDNMHDIGNIGFDIPLMSDEKGPVFGKFATTKDQFQPADMAQLYAKFFHQGLAISLDIPECGSTSWMYKVIASAAKGNQSAVAELRRAANVLTNGNFDKYYQAAGGTGQMVFSNDNTIFLGYYETKDGRKRDIRDLDYLAVCGLLGKKGRDEIRVYTDSYNGAYSLAERVAYRRTLINTNLSKVVFTGRAYRVSFEAAFINALVQGAIECNYHVTPQSYTNSHANYQRANASYINGAILNSNTSGIFRNAGIGVPGGNFYNGRFY